MEGFRVEQLDHVEVRVPDVGAAASWYRRVLGLTPVDGLPWTVPLMISSDGGGTKVALFAGEAQHQDVGWRRVAFRVTGAGFLAFLERLEDLRIADEDGGAVRPDGVVDHDVSWSIYFADPWGNRLEVTTYDYGHVAAALQGAGREAS